MVWGKQNTEMGFWKEHWFNNYKLKEILSVLIPFYIDGDNIMNFGTCRYLSIRLRLFYTLIKQFLHRCKCLYVHVYTYK